MKSKFVFRFEVSNPREMYVNAPEHLNMTYHNGKSLRSSFYIGHNDPRDYTHKEDVRE
jgi:hypothetical protein